MEKFEEADGEFDKLDLQKDIVVNAGVPVMLKTFENLNCNIPKQ